MPRKIITEQQAQGEDPMSTAAPAVTDKVKEKASKKWETEGVRVRHFDANKDPMSDAEKQYRHYATCPLVPFYIPLGWGEKMGAEQWFQANDLAVIIKKGQMVTIPKPIAESLAESLKLTADALNPLVLDGDGRMRRLQDQTKEIQR